jgi:hypothetical protein
VKDKHASLLSHSVSNEERSYKIEDQSTNEDLGAKKIKCPPSSEAD